MHKTRSGFIFGKWLFKRGLFLPTHQLENCLLLTAFSQLYIRCELEVLESEFTSSGESQPTHESVTQARESNIRMMKNTTANLHEQY